MRNDKYHVIVVGGGLVGASLALALGRAGRRVALLEAREPDFAELEQGWDARVYAVSPANRRFLDGIGAWPDMGRVGTIATMDVRGDAGGRIAFSASDAGGDADALAWIVENRWLLAAIWRRLRDDGVEVLTGAPAAAMSTTPGEARLTLADGRELRAELLVGADGANSWVRGQLGLQASVKPYGQSGVVANFICERPHGDIARQWFTGDSVLAWLPMAGNRISMVWSTSDPQALLQLPPQALAARVAEAGGRQLGAFETITPAAAFPLRLIQPEAVVAERVALVGDAAHTVHPLAGQGVNLGFQDAAQLAALLTDAPDCGDWMLLRRHQRQRREAVAAMQMGCDGLYRLFHAKLPGLPWLRNTGLSLTNCLAPLKRQFARQAIG
ncbi:ubiquinone biosynthesis protein UbiH [Chromobacterium sp. ATCC 53434]|uniref:UbiH/UbiF family hydroxylase n=1 Tax=Chromobacterium sp. (strain ATCC 53434 / SC 14030) TaxID=2059672 RepID=UPI000C75CB5F|nr:UbiH/UbiF family hydroxylase [Chromobacterium sp. ATCC 53434]AUH50372.1 ubiquinone biosynthesis protein UbiH [Chromobacterium sp. ATCC 53434]